MVVESAHHPLINKRGGNAIMTRKSREAADKSIAFDKQLIVKYD